MEPLLATVILVAVGIGFLAIFFYLTIRIVQQYEALVVFRLGKTNDSLVRGPWPQFLIPIVDRPVKVDLREQFIEVPSQTTITKDNAPINIDFLIYWQVVDPLSSMVNVAYFAGALAGHRDDDPARGHRRHRAGRRAGQARADQRGAAHQAGRSDRALGRQGDHGRDPRDHPATDVQDAMNRMLSAERTRRAVMTEAEGTRQATITVAEGEKQARSCAPRASGSGDPRPKASARRWSASSARPGVDEKTMALQYLDALKALGASPATKFVIPMEFTQLMKPFAGYLAKSANDDGPAGRLTDWYQWVPDARAGRVIIGLTPPARASIPARKWMSVRSCLVDDDPNANGPLSFTLQQEGYEVSIAGDGAEALKRWADESPT